MSDVTEWADLMVDTVVVNRRASQDLYGTASFSTTASTYAARVVRQQKEIRSNGEVSMTSHVAWIASTSSTAIRSHDKYTLPDGTTPQVLLVEGYPDENGLHHWKVTFGDRQ